VRALPGLLGALSFSWGVARAQGVAPAPTGIAARVPHARVTVRVRSGEGRAIEGAAVRSGEVHAATDTAGVARLELAPGTHAIVVVRLGLLPDTLRVQLQPAADTTLIAVLREGGIELAPVVVAITRADRRLEDEPERVEVLAGEDVDEKSQTRPADVTTVVREIPGVRLQTAAPATGAAGLRIQGLRAHYAAILVDGLPLRGTQSASLGLLQVPPLDLQQAEVIKGAATALYGPSALGGVLNLITRHPRDVPERTVLLNQTSRGGTDAAVWLSRRFNERWGMTLLGNADRQALTDVDQDGWADLPGFTRGALRPRLFWSGDGGRSLVATAAATAEDREGGGDGAYRQHVDTRHGDAGLQAHLPFAGAGVLALRGAWSADWLRQTVYDPVLGATPLADRRQTGFAEATVLRGHGPVVWLAGAAFQIDDYHDRDLPALDYRFTTPSGLAQLTWTAAPWFSASGVARIDAHSRYGTIVSPRVSLLARAARAFEARLSAASGFNAPTVFTEETEPLPLTRLRAPSGLAAERAHSMSLDLTARRGALEFNATGFVSRIANPVLLAEPPDTASISPSATAALANVSGPTTTGGFEAYAFYSSEPLTVTVNYAWLAATELSPEGERRDVALTPRHSAGLDVAWEEDESGTRAGIEIFYTGRQPLEHDPYRTTSAAFATIGVLVSQQLGRALVYVNAENLADVRQGRFEPILLPRPTAVGRLSVDSWAPAEGRTLNAGVHVSF